MSAMDVVPMLKLPASWPYVVSATVAMGALAALDLLGAFAAKEWMLHRSAWMGALGAASMVLLFWVYASALQFAELAVVTFGWIVLLQIGVLVLDQLRYDVHHSTRTWVAVAVMMAAQGYLVLSSPSGA
ncbi:MAG: hypothetical protein IPH03_15090 [Tetrasphaera sp.]|nr:hypothetical protein [Tetrasphaera sp.]